MRCYYEVLGVPRDADGDQLKKAYRKLVMQWHPDKNLHNLQESTEKFKLIQQAYDVLIDDRERAWYDRHREAILRGGLEEDYKDNCLNVFAYFNSSCFVGYGDDEKGFYAVYRKVFENIAEEDRPFFDEAVDIPSFGFADSSYDETVHLFYSHWQSYCTAKSFSWVDKYDIREAPNRRILRLMEKENKKLRDQEKKRRNEEVRQLVEFVRKRDKRVQAHRKLLEEKAFHNSQKVEEHRKRQIRERQQMYADFQESEWASMSHLQSGLEEIEKNLDSAFGKDEGTSNESENDDEIAGESFNDLYCIACDKLFKSQKAFRNHENSRKHKEMVSLIKTAMENDEELISGSPCHENSDAKEGSPAKDSGNEEVEDASRSDEEENDSNLLLRTTRKTGKKQRKKLGTNPCVFKVEEEETELTNEQSKEARLHGLQNDTLELPTQPGDKSSSLSNETKNFINADALPANDVPISEEKSSPQRMEPIKLKGKKAKEAKRKVSEIKTKEVPKESASKCGVCHSEFSSRNKLFEHLKTTGHAVYLPKNQAAHVANEQDCDRKKGKKLGKR